MATIISVLFSGVVAALVTYLLNRQATKRDSLARNNFERQQLQIAQKITEEWEERKYRANQRIFFFRTFSELFYAYRNELHFFALDMHNTEALYGGHLKSAEQFLRQQNPNITASELDIQKALATRQAFVEMNTRKLARLDKFNIDVKGLAARADTELSVAAHYLTPELFAKMHKLLKGIDSDLDVGSAIDALAKLQRFENYEVDFKIIQKELLEDFNTIVKNGAVQALAASGDHR